MNGFLGVVKGKIDTHNFSFVAQSKVRKFQYIKLYHEEVGFILAQIVSLINENDEITAECEIVGYRDSRGLLRIPNTTISNNSEVYNADSEFIKEVLGLNRDDGLYIGLLDSYNMIRVKLDYKKLISKHLAILAKTGAGKSYTLGVIVEELMEKGIPCLIIDPHGEYASLRYANTNKDELDIMHRYDIEPKGYSNRIIEYSPNTEINPNAKPLHISVNSLTPQEIATLTPIKINGTQLGLLYNAVNAVRRERKDYTLDDIRAHLDTINSNAKYGIYACFDFIENIGVFSEDSVSVKDLVQEGKVTLINMKGTPPDVQAIITAKICNDLFERRKRNEIPPLFLIIEEAHNFCPERSFGESPSSYILRNIASEGRKFGLGLGVVSQRPARIDKNVLSQCNTQIIQKVTNPNDLKAIASSSENIDSSVVKDISTLPIGVALVIGASARPIFVDIRVKRSEHGGKSVAIKKKIVEERHPEEDRTEINVINISSSDKLVPCYLAEMDDGNFLLLDENRNILAFRNGSLEKADINANSHVSHLGEKAERIYSLIRKKGETTITYLFNSFDYSFQDIDFILRQLKEEGLINIVGSRIIAMNKANYYWSIKPSKMSIKASAIPHHSADKEEIASFLASMGLNAHNIFAVFVK